MTKTFIIKETNKAAKLAAIEIPKKTRKFTKIDFFLNTQANFIEVEIPKESPDYTSNSGSQYYYTESGVIRVSNHWGRGIASCYWNLNSGYSEEFKAGYCDWDEFKSYYTFKFDNDGQFSQRGKKPIDWKN